MASDGYRFRIEQDTARGTEKFIWKTDSISNLIFILRKFLSSSRKGHTFTIERIEDDEQLA